MPNILKNKQLLQQYGLLKELPLDEIDSPAYQALIAQYGGEGGILPQLGAPGTMPQDVLPQLSLFPEFRGVKDILSKIGGFAKETLLPSAKVIGKRIMTGGEGGLFRKEGLVKPEVKVDKDAWLDIVPDWGDVTNRRAVDLVSALSMPKQAEKTALPEPPIIAEQLPAIPGAVTPENILEKAKGGKFASFISNPDFIRFLAEMGSAIGGEGSVGERLGQATIELQRSQIYDQAITRALAGEPFDDLPVHLLSVEERVSLDQQRLVKLETEAKIAELESKAAERDIPISEQYEKRMEEVKARGEISLKVAGIQAISRATTQGKTAFEVGDLIKKESGAAFERSAAAVSKGYMEVRPEFAEIDQANFIQNIGLFEPGGAKEQASRFFKPYAPGIQVGEKFYAIDIEGYEDGIYEYTEEGGKLIIGF